MKLIKKAVQKSLILALVLTIMLAAGVPMIVVGFAVIGGAGGKVLGAIGIVCTVIGFYCCPIAWIGFSSKLALKRVLFAIEEEHFYKYSDIAAQVGIPEKEAISRVDTCFKKQYLTGYKREADGISLNVNKALNEEEIAVTCENCGARYTYKIGQDARCPYCGSVQTK